MTRLRRALGPYAGKTLESMWRSLRMLLIVLIAAACGLWIIKNVNEARDRADKQRNQAFVVDWPLIDPAFIGPIDRPTRAMDDAVAKLRARPKKERSFSSRDALIAALLPEVKRSPYYPTVTAVVAKHQPKIQSIETAIVTAKTEKQQLHEGRRRDFALDAMRLDIIAVPEQQRVFVESAFDSLDVALGRPQPPANKTAGAQESPNDKTIFDTLEDSKHPLHVIYQALFYLAYIIVALAISYSAAILLKLLPYPGAAEKWSSKMEDTFSAERRSESKSSSPVASALLTTTVLGVGLLAATGPLQEQPGSPFYRARLSDLLPDSRNEMSMHGGNGGESGSANVTVQVPPYPNMSPTFEFNPAFNPVNPITVPPSVVTVEKPDLTAISDEMKRTNDMLATMQDLLEQETRKTDELQRVVTDAKREWGTLGRKIDTAGAQLRNSIAAANYNDEQRHLLASRQEATAGARSAWRGLLMLGRYQVNATTEALFETEPCENEALHDVLRNALKTMTAEEPLYQSPFEMRIVERMIGAEAYRKHGEEFKAARIEMWRHLPVLLETARIAERGLRKAPQKGDNQ